MARTAPHRTVRRGRPVAPDGRVIPAVLLALLAAGLGSVLWPGRGVRAENESPWPEPDAEAAKKLEDELKRDLPAKDFRFEQAGPWIVATDLDAAATRRFIDSTVRSYAADIQRQLFDKTPRRTPVKVYLFKDERSYNGWNQKLFGEKPSTPYGYYSRARKALVMNIGTGGGTLLHEMVHAMAEEDFPAIPAWLNEGLGSLYEASSRDAKGRVVGIANWRLTGLLADLKAGSAVKFADLVGMSDENFYGENSGSNYASARYLMQWLQAQGRLEAFYRRIRDKQDDDPQASLRAVCGGKLAVAEIEAACYAWVKTLKR